ncbi:hypothetical protein PUN28_009412 [Cardiocondyla obscurior]|uniref:THAP-type domain-containing protein n=1 Tax=Cardiocondyla obscurior TaxID=286306 RepID=A0AAW2FWY4_9HYME
MVLRYCYICKEIEINDNKISVHRQQSLTKNFTELRKKWFEFVGHEVTENYVICSKHFVKFDFINLIFLSTSIVRWIRIYIEIFFNKLSKGLAKTLLVIFCRPSLFFSTSTSAV